MSSVGRVIYIGRTVGHMRPEVRLPASLVYHPCYTTEGGMPFLNLIRSFPRLLPVSRHRQGLADEPQPSYS